MVCVLFAFSLALQRGSPTTPIPPPKESGTVVRVNKKPERKPPTRGQSGRIESPQGREHPKKGFAFVEHPAGWGVPVGIGDVVVIQFLVMKGSGETIADSRKRGLPYTFMIGSPGNDPLLDLVVKGMRVGGIRTGTVSAKDAYGPAGAPPMISPRDDLLVTITLLRRGEK